MLFAKPNVIDPNPTRNLHSRILFFCLAQYRSIVCPSKFVVSSHDGHRNQKIGDPKNLLLSDINQIHRKASGGVAIWCLAFFWPPDSAAAKLQFPCSLSDPWVPF
jgi:hypothetical protein